MFEIGVFNTAVANYESKTNGVDIVGLAATVFEEEGCDMFTGMHVSRLGENLAWFGSL